MILKKDYMLRQSERLGSVLKEVIGLRKEKKFEKAIVAISDAFRSIVGVDIKLINSLSCDFSRQILKTAGTADPSRYLAAARLLEEQADIQEETEDEDAIESQTKALDLYLVAGNLINWSSNLLQPHIIEKLTKNVEIFDLPKVTLWELFAYYQHYGLYAEAENILFHLVAKQEDSSQIIVIGKRFYSELLKKNDQELNIGGLPRNEIQVGLQKLESLATEFAVSQA